MSSFSFQARRNQYPSFNPDRSKDPGYKLLVAVQDLKQAAETETDASVEILITSLDSIFCELKGQHRLPVGYQNDDAASFHEYLRQTVSQIQLQRIEHDNERRIVCLIPPATMRKQKNNPATIFNVLPPHFPIYHQHLTK